MCAGFEAKRKAGHAIAHGSGYGGSGFKFDKTEDQAVKAQRKVGGRWVRRMELPCGIKAQSSCNMERFAHTHRSHSVTWRV